MASEFLFDSFESKAPQSTRKRHLKTVYDIMALSILRQDTQRAKRAWAILIRCPDFDTNSLWKVGLGLIGGGSSRDIPSNRQPQLDFLRATMLHEKENKEQILIEIILLLIKTGRYREALDEIDLYIPAHPYQDSPILHTYAGALKLYLAQPSGNQDDDVHKIVTHARINKIEDFDQVAVQDAQSHFARACGLDPHNAAAEHFLSMLQDDEKGAMSQDDDEESTSTQVTSGADTPLRPRKRFRG